MSHPDKQSFLPEPTRARWQVLRAGIQNIWEYDDQRFCFHHGRLLLRGGNESGKTKALEVLLPFLLDANLAPQRLDPFGSRSRPMKWNLVNDETREDHRIGYVWLELGRRDGEQSHFITIGAGLRAKRANPEVEDWYFITPKRVDRDLHLLDAQRVPLVRTRMAALLGDQEMFASPRDYRRAVNRRLFGMADEQYDALIDTLLQLRRPQLAKQLDPAELGRILTASLPTLKSEKIEPLAEGFERLDRHRAEREGGKEAADSLAAFLSTYRRYARAVGKARAQALTQAESSYHGAREDLRNATQSCEATETKVAKLGAELIELERAELDQAARLRAIEQSSEFLALKDVQRAEEQSSSASAQARQAEDRLARDAAAVRQLEERLRIKRAETEKAARECQGSLGQAAEQARAAELVDTQSAVKMFAEQGDITAARGVLSSALKRRTQDVERLAVGEQAVENAQKECRRAHEQHQDAEERVGQADSDLRVAQGQERTAIDGFRDSVVSWAADLDELRLDPDELSALLDQPIEQLQDTAAECAGARRHTLTLRLAELTSALTDLRVKLEQTRAEEAQLRKQTHARPQAPSWREPRAAEQPGAPLYLLCEFIDETSQYAPKLEAALEAAGMLDAWVEPDGTVRHPGQLDAFLTPRPLIGTAPRPTLLGALRSTPAGGVLPGVIDEILGSIELCSEDQPLPEEVTAAVAYDGRFRIGPLCGRSDKPRLEYIGATAREQARQRRLAELAESIARQEALFTKTQQDARQLAARLKVLDEELRRFPSLHEVLSARAAVKSAAERLRQASGKLQTALEALHRAEQALAGAKSRRDKLAADLSLTRWVGVLQELRTRTNEYTQAAQQALADAQQHYVLLRASEELTRDMATASARNEVLQEEAVAAHRDASEKSAEAQALRSALGVEPEELLRRRKEAATLLGQFKNELGVKRKDKTTLDLSLGALTAAVTSAQEKETKLDSARKETEAGFKRLAQRGFLRFLDGRARPGATAEQTATSVQEHTVDEPSQWSYTDTLREARRADAATQGLDCSPEARDKEENKVASAHQELQRKLVRDVAELVPERSDSVLEYSARRQGRMLHLLELAEELTQDIIEHDRLLSTEERRLIDQFLSGELYEHLADCLRRARSLIDSINEQLAKRQTASGMQIRLDWHVNKNAEGQAQVPAGAPQAIALMLRANALLADSDREALAQFMKQRLEVARSQADHGTLQQRLLSALDYRAWFAFTAQSRRLTGEWRELTKKTHGEGSGGQKAVVLHLPLFAAVDAFYEAASEQAPRLILLDEAFAGIDRKMKGRLMGCLREFDLDFMMTSFDEWGFYEELDGLATYELTREQGLPGVYTEWFLWDGRTSREMGPG